MSTLKQLLHLDGGEFPAVRAQIEAQPLPTRKPFRAAYTGVAADVLPELLADTSWSALGMRRPAAPPAPPSRDLIEYQTAVSCAMHADYERHLDTLATLDGISAVLIEHPALLAYPSHPGVRLGLRRALAGLDEPLPGSDWAADLRAVLPVATPKTEVA